MDVVYGSPECILTVVSLCLLSIAFAYAYWKGLIL